MGLKWTKVPREVWYDEGQSLLNHYQMVIKICPYRHHWVKGKQVNIPVFCKSVLSGDGRKDPNHVCMNPRTSPRFDVTWSIYRFVRNEVNSRITKYQGRRLRFPNRDASAFIKTLEKLGEYFHNSQKRTRNRSRCPRWIASSISRECRQGKSAN